MSENQTLNATVQSLQQATRDAKENKALQRELERSRSHLQHEQHAAREALGRASLLSQEVAALRSSIKVCRRHFFSSRPIAFYLQETVENDLGLLDLSA
jgi:hypothetical protein